MRILGHVTQIAHLVFVMVLQYWLGLGWGLLVFFSLSALSALVLGNCAFTIVANWFYAKSNHSGYNGVADWVQGRKRI